MQISAQLPSTAEFVLDSYDLRNFGDVLVPDHPLRFGFQVDVVPSNNHCTQLVIALVSKEVEAPREASVGQGFAVRVDLKTGEVWDMMNDTVLIGWVEKPMDSFTEEEPLLLNWEVEHHGSALIPRLQIANETFLYPALLHIPGMVMNTLAGSEKGLDQATTFMHPAVWRESL